MRRAARDVGDETLEDLDEEELERQAMEDEEEQELQFNVADAFSTMIKTHGADEFVQENQACGLMSILKQQVVPKMLELMHPNCLASDRKLSAFILDDLFEHMALALAREDGGTLFQQVYDALLKALPSPDAALRQATAFGVGMAAKNGGECFAPFALQTLQQLSAAVTSADAQVSHDNYSRCRLACTSTHILPPSLAHPCTSCRPRLHIHASMLPPSLAHPRCLVMIIAYFIVVRDTVCED
jgi:hypothetical protein